MHERRAVAVKFAGFEIKPRIHDQALVFIGTKDHRLFVLDINLMIRHIFFVGKGIEHAIIVDNAILENFYEGGAFVMIGLGENIDQLLLLRVDGASYKAGPGAKRHMGG